MIEIFLTINLILLAVCQVYIIYSYIQNEKQKKELSKKLEALTTELVGKFRECKCEEEACTNEEVKEEVKAEEIEKKKPGRPRKDDTK